jgi:hypothetical protein
LSLIKKYATFSGKKKDDLKEKIWLFQNLEKFTDNFSNFGKEFLIPG